MGILSYRPTSPGRRFGQVLDYAEITKNKPEKSLLKRMVPSGGRNNHGHVTAHHRGGGAKRMFRVIDFKRDKDEVEAKVAAIEYDPNRSARVALLYYADGEKRYILAPNGLQVGETLMSGTNVEPKAGNCMPLSSIPVGLPVHNVEMTPGRGAQLARSAGIQAQLSAREGDYAVILLASGEIRKVHVKCRATIGQVGNVDHINVSIGKAGRNRHRGWRPHVRGSAKNPVSHPHGGGEGRAGTGRAPVSATGVLSKGGKTRKPNHPSNKFIIRRRTK